MRISLVSCVFASMLLACGAEYAGSDVMNQPSTNSDGKGTPTTPAKAQDDTGGTTNGTNAAPTKTDVAVGAPKANVDVKTPAIDKEPPATPKAKIPLVAMNMSFSEATGDWLMSRSSNEGAPTYHFNGIQYRVFEAPPADETTQPLYRCIDGNGTHYQSNDFACEGAGKSEALLGYVYVNDPGNGAKEISRCIGKSGSPIVSTTRIADCDPFIVQQISLGFAFDASVTEAP